MKELMMNEDFSDVTLFTEDKQHIKANINILSACSPVFKEILKKEKNSNQIIYLRGVQYSEMDSIMQFIYLGETTFFKQRMDEFLAVAKLLEIRELCNASPEKTDDPEDEPLPSESNYELITEPSYDPENALSDQIKMQALQERQRKIVIETYECDQCQKTYSGKGALYTHKKSVHQRIKYACDQCDYQAAQKVNLTLHIQSKHEGVKFACDQCDFQGTGQNYLKEHIQAKHEGIKYDCDQCTFTASWKAMLRKHKSVNHKK